MSTLGSTRTLQHPANAETMRSLSTVPVEDLSSALFPEWRFRILEAPTSVEGLQMAPTFNHRSVQLAEVLDLFSSVPAGVVIDCTLGGAGHAAALLEARSDLRVLGIDRDPVALAAATAFLGRAPSDEVAELGLAAAVVPGRLEVLGHLPLLIVDGAHNAAGSAALAVALEEGFHVPGPQVCVLGMLEGRDPIDLLGPLAAAGIRQVVCVAPDTPRAMATEKIAQAASELGLDAEQAPSIEAGVDRALSLAGSDGMVLATGSLYVVGDARIALLASNQSS